MKLFIFGAGASKGSQKGNEDPSKISPLADELFSEPYRHFAADLGFFEDEIKQFDQERASSASLEDWLTKWWTDIPLYTTEKRKNADRAKVGRLQMYFWLLFQRVSETYNHDNVYGALLRKLNNADIEYGFVTFNYDTLLDRAVQKELGIELRGSIDRYIDAKLIKLHGSVNWFFPPINGDIPFQNERIHNDHQVRYRHAANIFFANGPKDLGSIVIEDPTHSQIGQLDYVFSPKFQHQYFLTCLFLPILQKEYNDVKGFSEKVFAAADRVAKQASEVYIIGYKGRDKIIQDVLKNVPNGVNLHVISDKHAEKVSTDILSWATHLKTGERHNGGFKTFVEKVSL